MKTSELKNLLKEAVREVFQEEMKNIIVESIKGNKQSLNESTERTLTYTSQHVPHQQVATPAPDIKKSYMDVLNEMAAGPKNEFEGEFRATGPIDNENGALPSGQLDLDTIMSLVKR